MSYSRTYAERKFDNAVNLEGIHNTKNNSETKYAFEVDLKHTDKAVEHTLDVLFLSREWKNK